MAASTYKPESLLVYLPDLESHLYRSGESNAGLGARLRLWAEAYRRGGYLPADDEELRELARSDPEEWAEIRDRLRKSWKLERGRNRYLVRRVRAQVLARSRISKEKSEAAAKGHANRKRRQEAELRAGALQEGVQPAVTSRSRSRSRSQSLPTLGTLERTDLEEKATRIGENLDRIDGNRRNGDSEHPNHRMLRRIVLEVPEAHVNEALASTRDSKDGGKLRQSASAYFAGTVRKILEREGLETSIHWGRSKS